MLIIDSNEAQENRKVVKAFEKHGIAYKIEPLPEGDFTNTKGSFIAERKGFNDFWNSMVDGRIDKQPAEMWALAKKNRYIFVEAGSLRHHSISKFRQTKDGPVSQKHWIYSKFAQCENWGVKFRGYFDLEDLALKLYSLDRWLTKEKIWRETPKKLTGIPLGMKILMQFDRVGKKIAASWLDKLNTVYNIFQDIVERDGLKSAEVKGLSRDGKILKKAKKAITCRLERKDIERFLPE